MKRRVVNGMSIGYTAIKKEFEKSIRNLQEIKLFEVSVLPWGMNELAQVSDVKSAIPYHDYGTAPEGVSWDGPGEVAKADPDTLKKICAWYDDTKPDAKSSYKLPHHHADGLKAVWKGVAAAMGALLGARGGADIPEDERKGVYGHLAKHYEEFNKEAPDFKSLDMTLDHVCAIINLGTETKIGKSISKDKKAKITSAIEALPALLKLDQPSDGTDDEGKSLF